MQLNRLWVILLLSLSAHAATWYVRPDGGTRYSTNMTSGQCDGTTDTAYSGTGVNQHCAFKDVRYFWLDGAYTTSKNNFPAYGWIGQGGDTYLIRGSIGTGTSYRVGWQIPGNAYDPATNQRWGINGDPANSSPPALPSGTAGNPTRFLGENYASCSTLSAKTQLHGGYGLGVIFDMTGASYIDMECLDLTDFAQCGQKSGHTNECQNSSYDFVGTGIYWTRTATHDTLNNVSIHGVGQNGMQGPTGDGTVMTNISIIGNGASGWNADNGDSTTGTGSLLVQHFNISWNGCVEEYPMTDTIPYGDCTDDSSNGYGDGFGTATQPSSPAWNATFDQGIASYNTQDGLDALHLVGSGSSMTITRVLAFSNMGQQLKIGGANGTAQNNVLWANCRAMAGTIPGTPSDYNSKLSNFCRASDIGMKVDLGANSLTTVRFNTFYSASGNSFVEVNCGITGSCDATSKIDARNNIMVGFVNNTANGYPAGLITGTVPGLFNNVSGVANPFANTGSFYANNLYSALKSNEPCPAAGETYALCAIDPQLTDETWHLYGYENATPLTGSPVIGTGVTIAGVTTDFAGTARPSPPSRGAIERVSAPPPSSPHSKGLRNAHCPRCRF